MRVTFLTVSRVTDSSHAITAKYFYNRTRTTSLTYNYLKMCNQLLLQLLLVQHWLETQILIGCNIRSHTFSKQVLTNELKSSLLYQNNCI